MEVSSIAHCIFQKKCSFRNQIRRSQNEMQITNSRIRQGRLIIKQDYSREQEKNFESYLRNIIESVKSDVSQSNYITMGNKLMEFQTILPLCFKSSSFDFRFLIESHFEGSLLSLFQIERISQLPVLQVEILKVLGCLVGLNKVIAI